VSHVLIAVALALVIVGVGGDARLVWLCLPPGLLVASRVRGRLGITLAPVAVVALGAGIAAGSGAGAPASPVLLLAVAAACGGVLMMVRTRLEREREVLRDHALSDPVTGIANRRSLLSRAEYEIERHRRARRSFALVMLDLDGFKGLNDRFGHAAGDDLLRDVATGLRRAMRAQDTVARLGGDEFCVLAPETDERGVGPLSARVSRAVRDVSAGLESVAGSVGVAIYPADGITVADLMHSADERLLEAKRARPGRRGQRRVA
jgi:diguanylate cyclase (GGDEF)-like protein